MRGIAPLDQLHNYVDSAGKPLTRRPDRISPGTCAVILNDLGEVLLERRSDNGFWGLPGGGVEIGESVQQAVVNYLNAKGLAARGNARGQTYGTDQRDTAIYASTVDLDEAYRVGQKAVLVAKDEGSGWMSTILREPGLIYNVRYDKVPLDVVANSERAFPQAWIAESRVDVTDEFVQYARPLIGEDWVSVPIVNGRQRFARLEPIFADKKCRNYTPQAWRK